MGFSYAGTGVGDIVLHLQYMWLEQIIIIEQVQYILYYYDYIMQAKERESMCVFERERERERKQVED